MKKYSVVTLNVEKDEPSFINDKAKWWLVEEVGDYYLYRVLTNEGESTYIGVQNSTKQVITVTQNYEAAMVALEFRKEAVKFCEKKKPRMTCKQYCPVWNDIDKDCEIYGEHHFTPRTCPHYNKELKQDD